MKNRKAVLLLAFLIGLTSIATASSLGTFTSETEVTTSGDQASFSITLMNTGDEPLYITLEPGNVDSASVRFSNNSFTLKASEPTRNPSDEGSWYYLGDGEYVETTTVDMTVFLEDSSSESFDVDIRAQPVGNPDQTSPSRQDIVQVRSYSYSVVSEGSDPENEEQNAEEDVGFDFGGGSSGGLGIPGVDLGGSDGESSSNGQETDGETDVNINESEDQDSGDLESVTNSSGDSTDNELTGDSTTSPTGNFFQSQNINGTTIILILGVMASATYLYKVM